MRTISWLCFELIYEVKSAVHIGDGSQFGISNKTRFYIPGKTIWGAITALITRWYMNNYDSKIYNKIGEFIRENLIFSYFYPYHKVKNEDRLVILHPNYTDYGFGYGLTDNGFIMSKGEFEFNFIKSYVSTSIKLNTKTAEKESLHEIELLNPIEFIGYVFVNINQGDDDAVLKTQLSNKDKVIICKDDKTIELFDLIKNIQVGGERTYGFGYLKLNSIPKKVSSLYNKYKLNLNNEKPTLFLDIALSHLKINPDDINKMEEIKGEAEPLVWRDFDDKKGMGHKKRFSMIALTPGSRFKKQEIIVSDFGIWHCI